MLPLVCFTLKVGNEHSRKRYQEAKKCYDSCKPVCAARSGVVALAHVLCSGAFLNYIKALIIYEVNDS
jgi:hypothetical protein